MNRLEHLMVLTLGVFASAGFLLIVWEVACLLAPERLPL